MFFSQSTLLAIVLAAASAVVAMPAPAGNTGTTATVNGVTYTNSRNGAEVACTRGFTQWCATRRSDDDVGGDVTSGDGWHLNDLNAEAGSGDAVGGVSADVEVQSGRVFNYDDDSDGTLLDTADVSA